MGREGKEIRNKGEEGFRGREGGGWLAGLRELGAWRDGNPNDYDDDDNGNDDDIDDAGYR